jgi:DNA-binding transcriptional ArsR family regulator
MDLEDALCSKTRIKILKTLLDDELNTTQIAKNVKSNYKIVRNHLEILAAEGILDVKPFGRRVRYYRFNRQSAKVRAVRALLDAWNQ